MTVLWLSGVFFQTLYTPKLAFRRGSAPDPAGELTTLPGLPSRVGSPAGQYPLHSPSMPTMSYSCHLHASSYGKSTLVTANFKKLQTRLMWNVFSI